MRIRAFSENVLPGADGARIAVADWPGDAGPLVCVHGLTSSSRAWCGLATELAGHRLLAVDCRGRGGSSKTGPFGLVQHAADIAAAMTAAGIERATMVGHSMGAYVVSAFAAEYPERVERLVFVDGGYFLPFEGDPDSLLETMIGPFLQKFRRTWRDVEEYLDYFRATPIYRDGIDDYGRAHLAYDLTGTPPEMRAKLTEACVAPDWREVLDHPTISKRLERIDAPVLLVRAPDGLTGTGDAVIPDGVRDSILSLLPLTTVVDVAGTNHHTVLCSVDGARAVAAAVREFTR